MCLAERNTARRKLLRRCRVEQSTANMGYSKLKEAPLAALIALTLNVVTSSIAHADMFQFADPLDWIIYTLCGTYDQPYRPGEGGDRDTVFACAKQFVGQQIVKQPSSRRRNGAGLEFA